MENTETLEVHPKGDGFEIIVQHDQTGSAYGIDLSKEAYEQLRLHFVSGSAYRYQMTYDQPCQIDCRVTICKFYKGYGKCENISPAITLNENGKFVCWSKAYR